VAQDQPITKAQGDVTADLLKRLGMNVDFAAIDWGTVGARRAQKTQPGQGGWNMFHTWHAGADCVSPAPYNAIRANGDKAWFGWPNLPEVQALIDAWVDAQDLAEQQKIAAALQVKAFEQVPYLPTGQYFQRTACRSDITGIVEGQFVFWNVRRT
jgi:peptide/nickel transport system substrate-binding protein